MTTRAAQATRMLALTCGAGSLLCVCNARAAEWSFTPSASVASAYTDNPRLSQEDRASSAGAVGEMSMTLRRMTERFELSLQPSIQSARYSDDDSLDSDDQRLSAQFRYINERSQWQGSAGLTRDTTLTSELGSTGLVQSNRRHEALNVSAGPTFYLTERVNAGAQASVLDNHYPQARDTGLVDYQYRAFSMFSGYSATPRSSFVLTARGGELVVPDQGSRTRDATLRLSWSYQPHSLWTAEVSAGPAYVDASFGHDSGVVFDFDLQRDDERWTLSANVGRNLSPTGRGVLTERDRVALSVTRQLAEFLSAGATAQWTRNQDLLQRPGTQLGDVRYARLDLTLSWRFAEHWSLSLAAGGARQTVHSRPGDAQNYRVSLSMVWNGQTQSL